MGDSASTTGTGPQPDRSDVRQRAGIVVIGNEVLSRKVVDVNTPIVLEAMARHGIAVGEVAVLADDEERIAEVVADFAARFDLVVTTGGVGPTHDDRTWRAVGRAMGRPIVRNTELLGRLRARVSGELTAEQERLADLPQGVSIVIERGRFLLHLDHVYVLPGVPAMVRRQLELVCARHAGRRPWLATVYFSTAEWDVVAAIDEVVAAFAEVEIGSYPVFDAADHALRVTFEAQDRALVARAVAAQIAGIGPIAHVRTAWSGPDDDEVSSPSAPNGAPPSPR